MAEGKVIVNLKIKNRLKIGVKLVSFLYFIKLNSLANLLFRNLLTGVEEDVMKYVKVDI